MLTIGIIGTTLSSSNVNAHTAPDAARLYKEIILETNRVLKEKRDANLTSSSEPPPPITDQQHPPAVLACLPHRTKESISKTMELLHTQFGADFLVFAEKLSDKARESYKAQGYDIFELSTNDDAQRVVAIKDLAKRVVTHALYGKPIDEDRRTRDENGTITIWRSDDRTKPFLVKKGGFACARKREGVPADLLMYTGSISRTTPVIGIVGGGGTLAGEELFEETIRRHVPAIMVSDTWAPNKNDAIVAMGESFEPAYQRDLKLLKHHVAAVMIGCNTAHVHIDEFALAFSKDQFDKGAQKIHIPKPILDIRDATITSLTVSDPNGQDQTSFPKKIILLATPATIVTGLYTSRLEEEGSLVIVPSEKQLSTVLKTIYKIKEWSGDDETREAHRNTILQVVSDLRAAASQVGKFSEFIVSTEELRSNE